MKKPPLFQGLHKSVYYRIIVLTVIGIILYQTPPILRLVSFYNLILYILLGFFIFRNDKEVWVKEKIFYYIFLLAIFFFSKIAALPVKMMQMFSVSVTLSAVSSFLLYTLFWGYFLKRLSQYKLSPNSATLAIFIVLLNIIPVAVSFTAYASRFLSYY